MEMTIEEKPHPRRHNIKAALLLPGAAGVTGALVAGEFKTAAITAALIVGAISIVSALLVSAWFHSAIEMAKAEIREQTRQ